MRVFVDTNIVISSILFPNGKTAAVFNHIIEHHDLVLASFCITETNMVFSRKFPDKIHLLEQFFSDLDFELFPTPDSVSLEGYPLIRDPCDYPVLVSAILSDSDILLTGDKDFESVELAKPLVFTPSQYFELITKKELGQ
ncbi:MAG TPA: PIN domain-containing protein [Treponemataceae bacterium]|nr:PIN domain-containing protein [Treponemataceae bacterium]